MDYDKMISEKKQEKQRLLDQMEVKKEVFLKELAIFTHGWFEKETMVTVKANSDKVIGLGEEKARDLKIKIKELKDRIPELVKQYLNDNHLWWHTNEDKTSYYPDSYNHKVLEKHDKKIRQMFGELGQIFIEFGIVKGNSQYDRTYSSSWSYESSNYNEKATLKYAYAMDFPTKIHTITKEYVNLIGQVQKINEDIEKVEDKKKRENVEEWWSTL